MRFGVLGPLEVRTDGGEPVRVPDLKVRTLLACLLAHRGETVAADRLVDWLWGAEPPADPRATLRARVSQLRRTLEDAEPGARALVETRPPGYRLAVPPHAVDAGRFEEAVARGEADALALWRGAAFADFAEAPFALPEIARLTELRLTAVEEGAGTRTAGELAALVARHPLRERLRAAHLRALYREGRQGEAVRAYLDLRDLLREELGMDPDPRTTALYEAILRRDPSLDAPRGNLPAPVTDLVGRDAALAEVRAELRAHRLVTLTGPGGVGKTRLAVEAARGAEHPDGVWLVEAVDAGTGVAERVAETAGLRDVAGGPADPVARLAGALRDRRMLLVLDGCERRAEEVAATAAALLRGAPGLRLLVTSREPLGVSGERVWSVPPLAEADAVALFAARAPGPVTDGAAVAAVCRRLDGLPLAVELAAARVRSMDVRELADRLDDRFRLLTGGPRDAPARQRTLRAVIDWSWEPLPGPERAVLRRLAVFADACPLAAAEAVCADTPGQDVLDPLARLVDRSLVVHTAGRYRLLESVAAYALERLREAGEEDATRARHRRHHLDLAERAALRGPGQRRWLDRLDTADPRAALDDAVRSGDADTALRLADALAWYWFLRGRVGEARRALEAAAGVAGPVTPGVRARVGVWRAGFAFLDGDGADRAARTRAALGGIDDPRDLAWGRWFLAFARAGFGDLRDVADLADRALAAFREHGDAWGTAAALYSRAACALASGDLATAGRDAAESLALFDAEGDRWGRMQAAERLGVLAEIRGDHARAARLHEEGLALAENLGLRSEVSYRLSRLGRIASLTGDHDRADELHRRAARLAAAEGNRRMEHFAEIGLALAARRRGDLDAAEALLRRWLGWVRRVDGAPGLALVLAELGFVAELRGDAEQARRLHGEGLAAARASGNPRAVALALEGLAGAEALAGRPGHAARLLAEAA
uniref:BTAD domain-containing putative transcriptional regulator n=1 Tax=Actinomadura kijaniata TaxID=46161 RepID=UPI0008377D18